ncbi:MAG: glycosyltransferase family 4 protein [Proteobacteria bacterium]|nr:glycosyltransferase family 4 protein [Pseudomonadota bacterium]
MVRSIARLARRAMRRAFPPRLPPIALVSDNADWALDHVAQNLHLGLERLVPGASRRRADFEGRGPSVVHLVSQYSVPGIAARPPRGTLATTSFMHGRLDEHPDDRVIVETLRRDAAYFPRIVVTTGLMARALADRGIDPARIVRIPLGVDPRLFTPVDAEARARLRARLGIPEGRIVVGSFQKDGDGWGEGDTPKLIKGPDVFCDVLEKVARNLPVFVALTGPARGYVKKRLAAVGIPFAHAFLRDKDEVIDWYRALDIYLVASRIEGGPLSIVESWATGIPLVTTNMGMAPDIAFDGTNALVRESEDVDGLAAAVERVAGDAALRARLVSGGHGSVVPHDWRNLARRHLEEIYAPILHGLGVDLAVR